MSARHPDLTSVRDYGPDQSTEESEQNHFPESSHVQHPFQGEGIFVSPNLKSRLSLRSPPERLNIMMAVFSVLTVRPQSMQYDERVSSIACKSM